MPDMIISNDLFPSFEGPHEMSIKDGGIFHNDSNLEGKLHLNLKIFHHGK
jgi:hypothetical protein